MKKGGNRGFNGASKSIGKNASLKSAINSLENDLAINSDLLKKNTELLDFQGIICNLVTLL